MAPRKAIASLDCGVRAPGQPASKMPRIRSARTQHSCNTWPCLDQRNKASNVLRMAKDVIANILHRDTIATIVGARTFERGERVLEEGRVLGVESTRGQLKGTVRPSEPGRPYAARIWIREDGVAYECTCPHGSTGAFCKHAVAIALFYVEKERKTLESQIGALRDRLM